MCRILGSLIQAGFIMTLGLSKAEADRTDVFLAMFMELPCILYSCGLNCCIQIIVGPHPRLALKSPNIRLKWPNHAKQGFVRTLNSNWMLGWDNI